MTGPLLRTGSLRAFHPLGAVGNPVYLAAAQLRAAMGRRLGPEVVDTFAIPQRNEDGDTIDWYAPAPGSVVPWSAATPEEQARAKERLLAVRDRVEGLGRAMEADVSSERQVFGRLLAHVTSFPGDDHVYLVDDRPVVTFWGFLESDAPMGTDPLLSLPVTDDEPAPPRRRIPWWVWLLLALLLLGLLYLLWWALREPPPEPSAPAVEPPALTQPPAWPAETPIEPPSEPLAEPPPTMEEPPIAEPLPEPPPQEPVPEQVRIREGRTWIDPERSVTEIERLDTGVTTEVPVSEEIVLGPATVSEDTTTLESGELVEGEAAGVIDETTGVVGETEILGETTGEVAVEPTVEEVVEAGDVAAEERVGLGEAPAEIPQDETPIDLQPPPGEVVTPEPAAGAAEPLQPGAEETPLQEPVTPPKDAARPGEPEPSAAAPAQAPEEEVTELQSTPPPGEASETPSPGPAQGTTAAGGEPDQPLAGQAAEAAASTRVRTVRLLDSGWRTRTTLQDPRTGLPVKLDYRLKDGAGRVELKRADGSVCGGDVKAAVVGGNLVIDSLGNIVCPDGTNFGRPTLECKPGADGRADCRGRYPSGESFSVDITQEPK